MNSVIITADGSHSLASADFKENYHSTNGAVDESRHVYIEAGLNYLLAQNKRGIKILEIGFGTGLNTFLTIIEAQKKNLKIEYCAIEAFPIEEKIFNALNYPEVLNSSEELFRQLHRQNTSPNYSQITQNFSFSKTISKIEYVELKEKFDLIYYDAFAPTTQPELWTEKIFQKMYDCLHSGGILVTYCAKGSFRRTLKSAGFVVEKLPGATGKREMTRATHV